MEPALDPARASILVVDDDATGRAAMTELLAVAGYEVRQAESGPACLHAVEERAPSLVLLDVSMPGMDGLETLRRLRARHGDFAVVLLTGERLDPESIGSGLTFGAEEYLIKPIRPRELLARVAAVLLMAEARRRSERARRERMAMLVHDLKQPMSVVALRAELLEDEALDAESRRSAAVIRRACQHMSGLVDAVLAVARAPMPSPGEEDPLDGAQSLDRRALTIEALVAEVAGELDPVARSRGIALLCDAPGRTTVEGDERKLRRVLHNLVGNALKFTPAGGRVEIACRLATLGSVEVRVSDTGPGLAAADAERIFERWAQTDVGRSKGGSGLGLAIAREIVDAHGGHIACTSEPGRGACFAFTLPSALAIVEDEPVACAAQ